MYFIVSKLLLSLSFGGLYDEQLKTEEHGFDLKIFWDI